MRAFMGEKMESAGGGRNGGLGRDWAVVSALTRARARVKYRARACCPAVPPSQAAVTIAIALQVGDGVVFGTDSATSIQGSSGIENVYFSGDKLFNLYKGLPIGAATYGLGGMGNRSISSLTKDLRHRMREGGSPYHIDPEGYTIEQVAGHVRAFFYEDHYVQEVAPLIRKWWAEVRQAQIDAGKDDPGESPDGRFPSMGFIIGGFSAQEPLPEIWEVEIGPDGQCQPARQVWGQDDSGVVVYRGQPDPLNRLLFGYTDEVVGRLVAAGVPEKDAVGLLANFAPLAHPAMPVQDAIDLVEYLVKVTCGFVRFLPGHPTVAEPIDLAAITKHEHFKWVRRKHYYPADRNPPIEPR